MSNERELFEQFANEHKMSVLRVADAYSDDDTNYAWWVWQKATASTLTLYPIGTKFYAQPPITNRKD